MMTHGALLKEQAKCVTQDFMAFKSFLCIDSYIYFGIDVLFHPSFLILPLTYLQEHRKLMLQFI